MDNFDSALQVAPDETTPPLSIADQSLPTGGEPVAEFMPLAKMLGYDQPADAQKNQLDTVWRYFSEGSKNEGETLARMRDIERSLAAPEIGQSRLTRIYSYVRLLQQSESLDQEKKAYQK